MSIHKEQSDTFLTMYHKHYHSFTPRTSTNVFGDQQATIRILPNPEM